MSDLRLLTFTIAGKQRYGAIRDDGGIIDLFNDFGNRWPTMRGVIADNGLPTLLDAAEGQAADFSQTDVTFDIPVPDPEKIICVGVNFPDRNAEYKDGQDAKPYPSLFPRFARSFVGHNTALTRPPESEQLDYEGEIALVIGKGGRRIAKEDSFDHIAGLTLCNEGTIRDWVRHAKFNVTQGKNFDGAGAIGPWIVPFTGETQLADIALTTRVNGETRQEDRTSRMMFNFAYLINYISTFTTLMPGDIIVTGTPTGAGARLDPPVWLKPGDVVEVEAQGIGILRNGIADEVAA